MEGTARLSVFSSDGHYELRRSQFFLTRRSRNFENPNASDPVTNESVTNYKNQDTILFSFVFHDRFIIILLFQHKANSRKDQKNSLYSLCMVVECAVACSDDATGVVASDGAVADERLPQSTADGTWYYLLEVGPRTLDPPLAAASPFPFG